MPSFDDIAADFSFLDDWDEKYRYLIDLGRNLPALNDTQRNEETRVRGCASQVWLDLTLSDGTIRMAGDSDAAIVKGLVALMVALYDDLRPEEILAINAKEKLASIELQDHITPQRSNGVASMITRIRTVASEAVEKSPNG